MFKTLGFNGATPLCIIWWEVSEKRKSRTVCYTEDDKKWALDRFNTSGDFYNSSYDKAVIDYGEEVVEYTHVLEKVGA